MDKRLPLADILKGIAVVRMVLVHLMDVFALAEISGNPAVKFIMFLAGPPGAALFMLIMGYFVAKSEKSFHVSAYRGLKLIVWGLLLNIGMNFHLLFLVFSGSADLNPWPYLFGVDILFLAGFSLVLLAAVKRLFDGKLAFFILLFFILSGAGSYLPHYSGELQWPLYLQAYFYGNASWSYFPVFPWAAYPVAGYIFYMLNQWYGISSFTRKGYTYAAVALLVVVAVTFRYGFEIVMSYPAYYHHASLFALWLICLTSLWVILIHMLTKGRESNLVLKWFSWVGRSVTNFYVIQWLLIGNIGTAVFKTMGLWQIAFWFVAILLTSSLLTFAWQKFKIGLATAHSS